MICEGSTSRASSSSLTESSDAGEELKTRSSSPRTLPTGRLARIFQQGAELDGSIARIRKG
jgi:hypothetical protein